MVLPCAGNINRDRFAAAFALAAATTAAPSRSSSAFSACQLVVQGLGLAVVDPFAFRAASGLAIVARRTGLNRAVVWMLLSCELPLINLGQCICASDPSSRDNLS